MRQLTNDQIIELRNHSKTLEDLEKKIEESVKAFNYEQSMLLRQIESDIESYEFELAETNEFLSRVYDQMEEYYIEHAEESQKPDQQEAYHKWSKAYQQWMQEWQEPLNKVQFNEPQNLSIEGLDASEILDELPEEPYE